jgi:hypothetical protein
MPLYPALESKVRYTAVSDRSVVAHHGLKTTAHPARPVSILTVSGYGMGRISREANLAYTASARIASPKM